MNPESFAWVSGVFSVLVKKMVNNVCPKSCEKGAGYEKKWDGLGGSDAGGAFGMLNDPVF
jgi:hypothetical protein